MWRRIGEEGNDRHGKDMGDANKRGPPGNDSGTRADEATGELGPAVKRASWDKEKEGKEIWANWKRNRNGPGERNRPERNFRKFKRFLNSKKEVK